MSTRNRAPRRAAHGDLGCLEGHFEVYSDDLEHADDIRTVAALVDGRDSGRSIERHEAFDLARRGGPLAAFFLAEYAPLDVVCPSWRRRGY